MDLSLRAVTDEDIAIFFEHQLDEGENRTGALIAKDWDTFSANWRNVLTDDHTRKRTILVDGAVAGHVVSYNLAGRRTVGYRIGRAFAGRGVTTRAMNEFLTLESVRPLYANVARTNLASIRVLEKCGFIFERAQIGAPDSDGRPVDEFVYRLDG